MSQRQKMRQYQIIFQAMQKTLPVLAENEDGHPVTKQGFDAQNSPKGALLVGESRRSC